ncbi:hypothetical protein BJ742DRAFT_321041 [Cladochytrium replicatum]|nr:hypothetical protein BJ742DRAFT_321041 [Cladochytrium replicatum]
MALLSFNLISSNYVKLGFKKVLNHWTLHGSLLFYLPFRESNRGFHRKHRERLRNTRLKLLSVDSGWGISLYSADPRFCLNCGGCGHKVTAKPEQHKSNSGTPISKQCRAASYHTYTVTQQARRPWRPVVRNDTYENTEVCDGQSRSSLSSTQATTFRCTHSRSFGRLCHRRSRHSTPTVKRRQHCRMRVPTKDAFQTRADHYTPSDV